MDPIKRSIDDVVKNKITDKFPTSVRCEIWTGLMHGDGLIKQCPGYIKEQRIVYICAKDRLKAFHENKYNNSLLRAIGYGIEHLIGANDIEFDKDNERAIRLGPSSFELNTLQEADISKYVKQNVAPRDALIKELAFFDLEVLQAELASNEGVGLDRAAPGGIVDPRYCDVEISCNSDGSLNLRNARLIRKIQIDPILESTVPKGGGEPLHRIINRRDFGFTKDKLDPKYRIEKARSSINSMYNLGCYIKDPDLSLDGDVWVEGIRSSISNGVYEVWVDDVGLGPMLRTSRNKVEEATSRYIRKVQAAQMRYATERDNPLAAHLPSTSITPIQTYINDWFGDPSLYAGIASFLMQLASGLEDKNKTNYKKLYYDLGTLDYNRIYNKLDGKQI